WDTILRPTAAAYADQPASMLFAAGPPVGDVVVAAALMVALRRRPDAATGEALAWVAAGMVAYVISDLVYAWASLHEAYVEGGWIDGGWLLGSLLVAQGARQQVRGGAVDSALSRADEVLERGAMLMPLAAIGLGFVLILRVFSVETLDHGRLGTAVGAVVLCVIVLVREMVSAVRQAALSRELAVKNAMLAWESERSERLLRNVLPDAIAVRLKDGRRDQPLATSIPSACVLFADLVGFTRLSSRIPPEQLITLLDDVFSRYDALAARYGLEKIKTIGDAYMAAAGVPLPHPDPATATVRMALAMHGVVAEVSAARIAAGELDEPLRVRVGVHAGPLVAGVIGQSKFAYDLWGDTVNTASRLESHGVPDRVQISDEVRVALSEAFELEDRGEIELKGKGPVRCWVVVAPREGRGVTAP
ncbi:MAG TPA: adenylate/guanylate cyclase domain-containing protein, partial [Myxococcota bacterium]|nr:adenylate/guanylate cyclase domain-containing protein [Myxococcota bacterium]